MPVHIKKVVYDPQGRIVEEYEGDEAEVENYEKKSQKKRQSEDATKSKKEILRGKELEEFRKIVREEIEKMPPRIEYRYYPYIPQPQWVNPWWQPAITWYATNGVSSQSAGNNAFTLTTAGSQPVGGAVSVYPVAQNKVEPTNAVWSTFGGAKSFRGDGIPTGQTWSGLLGGNSSSSSNLLMSPRS